MLRQQSASIQAIGAGSQKACGRFRAQCCHGHKAPARLLLVCAAAATNGGDATKQGGRGAGSPDASSVRASGIQPAAQANCYGCGAPLQTSVPLAAGYVPLEKFAKKRQHRQLNRVLCNRCSGLCNGAMIPAVEDFVQKQQLRQLQDQQGAGAAQLPAAAAAAAAGAAAGGAAAAGGEEEEGAHLELMGKLLISPEDLRKQLLGVASKKALVVLLVDLLDASGTTMSRVRDMVGRNPILLVGTKMDLLPEGTHPRNAAEWLLASAERKRLNVASVHLVSAHTGEGVASVVAKVARERKGRDVYVMGAANVGKSAFVRAALREMGALASANFDAAAAAQGRYLPVESAMPGTTLGMLPLRAFETGGVLYDTPGVHLCHRVPHMLLPDEVKLLHPRKRLRAYLAPTPAQVAAGDGGAADAGPAPRGRGGVGAPAGATASATYLWSGLVRVDVLDAPPGAALAFYGPPALRVFALPLLNAGDEVDLQALEEGEGEDEGEGGAEQVLLPLASVAARGGLVAQDVRVPPPGLGGDPRAALADIAVSGLPGWVSVFVPRARTPLRLRVWAPRGVGVFLRPPLPCPSPLRLRAAGEEDEGQALGGALGDEGNADALLGSLRAGLDLKALGLEGEEEAVAQLLFGSDGEGAEGGGEGADWWQEDAGEEGEEAAWTAEWEAGERPPLVLQGRVADVVGGRKSGGGATSGGWAGGDEQAAGLPPPMVSKTGRQRAAASAAAAAAAQQRHSDGSGDKQRRPARSPRAPAAAASGHGRLRRSKPE